MPQRGTSPDVNLSPEPVKNTDGSTRHPGLDNHREPEHRQGAVQLIDAAKWFQPLRENLGKKNRELGADDVARICNTFLAFERGVEL